MSDEESTNSGSYEEVTMYRCRLCPDQEFTAAERDLHRQQHRRDRRPRNEPSETVTLFMPIETSPRPAPPPKSPRAERHRKRTQAQEPAEKDKPGPASSKKARKIRSTKKYDRHVEQPPTDGG